LAAPAPDYAALHPGYRRLRDLQEVTGPDRPA
jgi:hypothetical protein